MAKKSKPPDDPAAGSDRSASNDRGDRSTSNDRGDRSTSNDRGDRSTSNDRGATEARTEARTEALIRRHLAFGWWSLTVFTALGLVLEAAHGLKLGWYLDLGNATRRLSFTLGHAHGTLLGLVNLAFAFSLRHLRMSDVAVARASFALRAVTVLMPLGFLIGGIAFYAGDPGFGIALVPPTGALLVVALAVVAKSVSTRPPG